MVLCLGYFRNIHVLYPILNAKTFLHDWPQFYDVLPPKHAPVLYSRSFLIVAIGSLSQPLLLESDASVDAFCQGLQQQAWRMLHDVLARPYAASVQVLLLHVRIKKPPYFDRRLLIMYRRSCILFILARV